MKTLHELHLEKLKYFHENPSQKKAKDKYMIQNASSICKYYEAKENNETIDTSQYLWRNNPNEVKINKIPIQCSCGGELIADEKNNVCLKCAEINPILSYDIAEEDKYDDTMYSYSPICHFKEVLSHIQGNESTTIPPKQIERIKCEIEKNNFLILDFKAMRKVLKKLKLSYLYEHTFYLLRYFGQEVPFFSREQEKRLIALFKQIEAPYSLYCPPNRKSFLNYHFVLKKLCILINVSSEIIEQIPQMKEQEHIQIHDKIWRQIADYNKWK